MATKDRELPHHLSKDAAAPVIHHDAEETILARWLKGVVAKGPAGWLPWVAGLALVAAAMTAIGALLNRPPAGQEAWTELMVPPTIGPGATTGYEKFPARVRPMLLVADQHPNTPAARWARLRAGLTLYEEGLRDLPNRKEVGRPLLEEAIKQFDAVLAEAGADAPEAEMAAMGKARALETRGELDKAIEQYEQVAAKWPNGRNAKLAAERAAKLQTPEAREFYENFYAIDFSQVGSTGGGLDSGGLFNLPGVRSGSGPASLFGEPAIPPLGGVPAGAAKGDENATPPAESELPRDPFAAPTEPAPASGEPNRTPPVEPPAATPGEPSTAPPPGL